jgi:hypothetical protein
LSSVATPAHARVNNCPTGDICTAGGTGQQGGGIGSHEVTNFDTDTATISGGQGHLGGLHETQDLRSGEITCVGSLCP